MCVAQSFSHVRLFCDPMDCSPRGSFVHEVLQQKYWCGLPFPPPGDLFYLGIKPASPLSPAFARIFFTAELPRKPWNEIIWLFFPFGGVPWNRKGSVNLT